ncbi:carbohydrate ABC transporter permease [Amorphoplanes digitatis]|uniref:Putative aldouronate transport system permease protein n=1 Tax=Actinoplanes digitatis TaxID=1868 RepID=A0A7W7HZU9_9ACTN|nr:carbohydrate ABC transporter permease [Actinoplanes digitatis]MBB4763766.1 putative aldouronate transport system permease protein [Actinoplanes digitatis]GID92975.1 ABC transporter permease [Actinoplanes digitatis]
MTTTTRRRHPSRPAWEEEPGAATQAARGTVLTLVVLAVLVPLWVVLVTSVSSREAINAAGGLVVVPRDLDFSAYRIVFSGGQISKALLVSTLVTVVGTTLSLAVTVLAAYGLSRPGSLLHRGLLFYFLLTFLIYPGLVPHYLVVTGVGLKDSLWALILPTAVSVFNLVVVRAFFQNIPAELLDSARVDGAGEFRILWRIVLPLSKAVIAVVGLFYAVGYWNTWFNALLYIDDNEKFPIQRVLQSYILAGQAPQQSGAVTATLPPTLAIKMAVVVVTVAPIALVYPFVQRHFTRGVIVGAVKG